MPLSSFSYLPRSFAQTGEHEEELAEISEQRIIEINREIETRLAGIEKNSV